MTNRSRRKPGTTLLGMIVIFMLVMSAVAGSAGAQATTTSLNLNSYLCPAGYDRVSDCTKIGDVVVSVTANDAFVAEASTLAETGVVLDVPVGSLVGVSVVGGAPSDATMEPISQPIEATEGGIAITLVFVANVAAPVDTDGDGLSDDEEAALGTDPADADSDDDGVLDGGEVNAGTDPLDADSDDDGFLDFEELEQGTDPLDPASFPADQEPNSLTVIAYNCPAGYEGKDPWYDCREPAEGVDFVFALWASEFAVTATTDAAGTARFTDLGSGEFRLIEDTDDLDFDLGRTFLHCNGDPVSPDAPEPRQVTFDYIDASTYGFTLTSGESITCSWFNIPATDDAAPKPTPTPAAPVKRLPSTGDGSGADATNLTFADGALAISGAFAASALIAAFGIRITRRRT